jgi:hypothetical protein
MMKYWEILYVYLDRNRDGTIDYDEFLIAIRVRIY